MTTAEDGRTTSAPTDTTARLVVAFRYIVGGLAEQGRDMNDLRGGQPLRDLRGLLLRHFNCRPRVTFTVKCHRELGSPVLPRRLYGAELAEDEPHLRRAHVL